MHFDERLPYFSRTIRSIMEKSRVSLFIALLCCAAVTAQDKPLYSFRIGAQVAAGLSEMADNSVGIGGLAGAERVLTRIFALEAEAGYIYFTGDKAYYEGGKNNAFAVPVLVGMKAYLVPSAYVGLRAGFSWFAVNDMSGTAVRPAVGIAAGLNLPRKDNRVNVQAAYTRFGDDGVQRGYASLAASIIIN